MNKGDMGILLGIILYIRVNACTITVTAGIQPHNFDHLIII